MNVPSISGAMSVVSFIDEASGHLGVRTFHQKPKGESSGATRASILLDPMMVYMDDKEYMPGWWKQIRQGLERF